MPLGADGLEVGEVVRAALCLGDDVIDLAAWVDQSFPGTGLAHTTVTLEYL